MRPSIRSLFVLPLLTLLAACAAETSDPSRDPSSDAPDEASQGDALIKPGGIPGGGGTAVACYATCTSFWGTECAAGEVCSQGQCRTRPMHAFCDTPTTSRNDAGDRVDCGGYRCNASTGLCRRSCASGADCGSGYTCDIGAGLCTVGFTNYYGVTEYWPVSSDTPVDRVAPIREAVDRCPNTCTSDGQCRSHEMCYHGSCEVFAPHCFNAEAAIGWDRVARPCGGYKCSDVRGQCLEECRGPDDCAWGHGCLGGACVAY